MNNDYNGWTNYDSNTNNPNYIRGHKMTTIIRADYTKTSKWQSLSISSMSNGKVTEISRHVVTSKSEARKLAKSLNAQPYNF